VDPGVLLGEDLGDVSGAIRGVVVHNEDFDARVLGEHLGNEQGQVLALVVGRDDDDAAAHGDLERQGY
jgi:hypothetical protein